MFGIILLSIFLTTMIFIGFWGMKKTKTLNDFFLGGRTIGPWISAFAYGTTYFSAVLFIGFAGSLGWGFGLNALWVALGNAIIGTAFAWLILARRTRTMTHNLNTMTMPEFLCERYNSKWLKIISALIIFIFLVPYSASVFKGLGHLFEVNFGINYDLALLIMIGITGIYLILGGYFAVALTDFIQGFIMIIGSIFMILILVYKGGCFSRVIQDISVNYQKHIPLEKQPSIITIVSLVFMTSFGTWGLPQMVQKFYSIKNEKVIPRATFITTVFALIIGVAAYFTGSMTHIFFEPSTLPITAGKVDFDKVIPTLLTEHLHPFFMGIILLLILSASMSTLSSLVLVSSSVITVDIYQGFINPSISKKNALLMIRVLSGIFVVFSLILAKFKIAIIVTLMSLSWGTVAGSLMGAYFYSLFWKKTTKAGVFSGIISGLFSSIILYFLLGPKNAPLAASISMVVPFIIIPFVSLFTRRPDDKIIKKAFENI